MSTTLGGYPCLDPVTELAAATSLGQPTEPWWREANCFLCPLGPGPGRGMALMAWEHLSRLDREASHDMVFAGGDTRVALRNLVIGNAYAAACGARGDSAGTFWVEVFDRRALALAAPPVDKAYNVLSADGTDYESATKNGGSAWTWAEMVGDIWATNGLLDAFPGLPFTPDGTPEGFVFWGVPSYDALMQVLDRIGCALKLDPLTDTYSIVRISVDDEGTEAALARADPVRIWDNYPVEPARLRVPESVRVFFGKLLTVGDTTGASPYYTLDRTDPTAGGALTGVQAGTMAVIFDDMSAVYDDDGNLTNSAALGTRADERASDYFRRLREERFSRRYSGAMSGILPGPRVKGTLWADRGGGVVTDVYRGPGYGPTSPGITGAEGEGEASPFPEPGPPGQDGAPGKPGGAGRRGPAGGRGRDGAPGRPGTAGRSGLLVSLLWPILLPLVRSRVHVALTNLVALTLNWVSLTLNLITVTINFIGVTVWNVANNWTINLTNTYILLIQHGTLKVTSNFYLCGWWAWCYDNYAVATSVITQLVMPNSGTYAGQVVVRLTGITSDFGVAGILKEVAGQVVCLVNTSATYTATLLHEYTSGTTAADRLALPDGTDYDLPPHAMCLLWYDEATSRWRLLAGRAGSGGGVPDGDKGDITVSSSGATWTIDANAVSDAKLRQSAGLSVVGRSANSTGDVADITAANDAEVLRRDGTALGFGKVKYAGIQDVSATARILGRRTSGAGVIEECTLSEVLDLIGSAAHGDILYRGSSSWSRLAAGTAGRILQTAGASADPAWAPVADINASHWVKVTKSHTDFQAAATANDIEIYSLPAGYVCNAVIMRTTAVFNGGPIASYTLSVGTTASAYTDMLSATNVFSTTVTASSAYFQRINFGASTSIRSRAVCTGGGATLNNSTSGSVTYHLCIAKLAT